MSGGRRPESDLEQEWPDVERELAETQRLAEIGTWTWEMQANSLRWSDQMFRLYGLEPQAFEPTFENFLAHLHPDHHQDVWQCFEAILDGREEAYTMDHRVVRVDGQVQWQRGRGYVVRDEHGKPVRLFGTAQNITATWEAEQKLREQHEELAVLASVVHATDDSVIVTSPDGTIQSWNPGAERLYGHTAEEAVGQHVSLVMSDEQTARLPDILAQVAERGHLRTDSVDAERTAHWCSLR